MADWFDQNGFGAAPPQNTNPYASLGASGSLNAPVSPWTGVAPTGAPLPNPSFTPTPGFTAPKVTDDPGYAFRLQQTLDATQRLAAAKGTLLSSGTIKAAQRNASDLASQEYQNAYNRALGENQLAYGRALGENQLGYQRGMEQNTTQYGRGLDAYTSAYNTFLNNAAATRANQQDVYSRLSGLTGIGENAAAGTGNLALQSGNAAAAGTIGSANAWGGALNSAQQLALLYGLGAFNHNPGTTPPYFPRNTAGYPPDIGGG